MIQALAASPLAYQKHLREPVVPTQSPASPTATSAVSPTSSSSSSSPGRSRTSPKRWTPVAGTSDHLPEDDGYRCALAFPATTAPRFRTHAYHYSRGFGSGLRGRLRWVAHTGGASTGASRSRGAISRAATTSARTQVARYARSPHTVCGAQGSHPCPLGRDHRSRNRWRRLSRTALKCCIRRTRAITRTKRLR